MIINARLGMKQLNDVVLGILNTRRDGYIHDPNLILSDYRKEEAEIKGYHGRELLELLQNAVDELTDSCERSVKAELCGNTLRFSNNGNVFSEDGITSIIYPNLSPKHNKSEYIGNKGTGFRAVLNWAECVRIYSGELSVEFSQHHADVMLTELLSNEKVKNHKINNNELKVATLVAPAIIPALENKEFDTVIEILAGDGVIDDIRKQLSEISASTLLFLERLERLSIVNNGSETVYVKFPQVEGKITQIETWHDGEQVGVDEWIVTHRSYQDGDNKFLVSIAYKPDMTVEPSCLYSYFKTKVPMPFPVLIHATLDLDANRNHLNELPHNRIVLGKICELMTEIAKENYSEVDYAPLKLLSPRKELPPELSWADFETTFVQTVAKAEVFPSVNGRYISFESNPKFYARTNIADYLSGDKFGNLLPYSEDTHIRNMINRIAKHRNTDLRYPYGEITEKINPLLKRLSTTERAALCVRFLNEYKDDFNNENRPNFIIDTDKRDVLPRQQVFLPSEGGDLPKPPKFARLVFMDKGFADAVRVEMKCTPRMMAEKLSGYNVREYAMQPLIQSVIARYNSRPNKESNKSVTYSIDLIKWLWRIASSGRAKDTDIQTAVASIPLLNRAGHIVSANALYLGKEYGNQLVDDIYVNDDSLFVAPATMFEISANEEEAFTNFLLSLGVAKFPRRKLRTIKSVPREYKALMARESPYPVQIGWDGFFHNPDDFFKAQFSQVTVIILEHYEDILNKAKTAHILKWLMADSESLSIITAKNEVSTKSNGFITWGQKQTGRQIPNTLLPSFMRYEFARNTWFEIGDSRYSPLQCLFKGGIGDKLLPYAIEPDLDDYVSNARQTHTEKNRLQDILVSIGASKNYSGLSTEALYGILLMLPEIDTDGSISKSLYSSVITIKDDFLPERKNSKYQEFAKNGQVFCKWGKGFVPCSDAKYLTRMISREVQKSFCLVDIQSRKDSGAIRKFLCVPPLEVKGKISGNPIFHALDEEFQKDFANFKDYAFCYRVDNADSQEVNNLKSLKVRLCSELSADYGAGEVALDNCSFMHGLDCVYLKVFVGLENVSAMRSNAAVSEAVAEIITSLADIQDGELLAKLSWLYSQNRENRQTIILREFDGLEILTKSKMALDSAIDISKMLETVCSEIKGALSADVLDIIRHINFIEYSSLKNAPLFIRLLDELGVDAEEFNIHSEKLIHIDLRPFFSSEISRISLARKAELKNALYAQLSESSIEYQKGFLDELDGYTRFEYRIENTKHTDVEQVFLAQWEILSDANEPAYDADAAWRRNRDAFEAGKDKKIISDLLSDKAFDSLLYFGAVDDLEKMYNSRVKTIEEKSKTDADVLGSSANLHAPISEINVIAPKSTPANTKRSGTGSRKTGMVAERENARWGAKAEEIVYNSFKDTRKSVMWVSENAKLRGINTEGIAGLGYDLTYIDEDGQLIYVEIKSSTSDSVSFMMSANEMVVAEREAERYVVALVVNVENDDMRKIYEIKNLFVYDEDETRYSNERFHLFSDNFTIRCIIQE